MAHVTFIHGIQNKPPAAVLLAEWKASLAADMRGDRLSLDAEGVTSSMVYWANVLYANPQGAEEVTEFEFESLTEDGPAVRAPEWDRAELTGAEREFVDRLMASLQAAEPEDAREELLWLPEFIARPLMEIFARDVHHYLFNARSEPRPGEVFRVQDEIRRRFVRALQEGAELAGDGPHVVVSHSMGTVIAYDCLKRVPDCPPVAALLTIGSPLGLDEIQDQLKPEWSRENGYPHERVGPADAWANVYDRLDPIAAFDRDLADDYRLNDAEVVRDTAEQSWGPWRHDIAKYLRGPKLRRALRGYLGVA